MATVAAALTSPFLPGRGWPTFLQWLQLCDLLTLVSCASINMLWSCEQIAGLHCYRPSQIRLPVLLLLLLFTALSKLLLVTTATIAATVYKTVAATAAVSCCRGRWCVHRSCNRCHSTSSCLPGLSPLVYGHIGGA